jgi:cation diffusion facilitator CzcD-associated flavoprotein CzcO
LIVGFGNSGGEIAIDLWEHGAKVGISVRSPSNIIPRDLFGIPIMALALLLGKLPAPIGDALTAPILRIVIGDLTRFGLRKLPYGPMTQIKQDSRIPLIDIGTLDLIRQGHIEICRGIERFTADRVVFTDASEKTYDAVILATGYRARIDSFLENVPEVLDESGNPRGGDGRSMPGLYFCGFHVPPTGVLREIAIEAQNISGHIAQKNSGPARARHENVGRR